MRSPFGIRSGVSRWHELMGGVSAYAVAGFEPPFVADFKNEYYRIGGAVSTFDGALTHARTGNATMVDSDGLLKWGPHNLALNSATPATQSITVISGADYTVECTGVSIALSGAGTRTVTEGNPVEITASTTTLTLTVTGSTGTMWAYRSDLGGMVANPDTGNSYVPTTSAARYLARRGNHVYNGTSWVDEGYLHESEARTNVAYYSNDISNTAVGWTANSTITSPATGITGIDGVSGSPFKLIAGSGGAAQFRNNQNSITSGQDYALCAILKDAGDGVYAGFLGLGIGVANEGPVFDLVNGTVDKAATTTVVKDAGIEPWGDGWYFCWARVTSGGTQGVALGVINSATDNTPTGYTWTGDNTSGYYVAYVGCEQTSGMPSIMPIPTSGSTVTRAADTLQIDAGEAPYSATAMSIQMDGTVTGDTQTTARWYLDASNAILQDIGSTDFTFTQEAAGVVDTVTGGSFTSGINVPFNIASRHGSTFINGAVDGTALTADTTPKALPDLSATAFQIGYTYMGNIGQVRLWADDLGNDGIEEAST